MKMGAISLLWLFLGCGHEPASSPSSPASPTPETVSSASLSARATASTSATPEAGKSVEKVTATTTVTTMAAPGPALNCVAAKPIPTSFPVANAGRYTITIFDPSPSYRVQYGDRGSTWTDVSLCSGASTNCWKILANGQGGQYAGAHQDMCISGDVKMFHMKKPPASAPAAIEPAYTCSSAQAQTDSAVFSSVGGLRVGFQFKYLGTCP